MNRSARTVDKGLNKTISNIEKSLSNKAQKVRFKKGSIGSTDIANGELVFSTVDRDSLGPGSPSQDEARLYIKSNGVLYEIKGQKVGS